MLTRVLAVSLVLAALVSCRKPAPVPAPPPVRFEDITESAGIARRTPTYDAAIGDFDGDGWPDIYVGNHEYEAVLLRNDQHGHFVNVLADSGIAPTGDKHGTAWTDYDNDGLLDLFQALGAFRGQGQKANPLYHNVGAGHFVAAGAGAGVDDPTGRSRAAATFDFDGDGLLDLLVTNYATPSRLFRNRGDGTFEDVSAASGILAHSAGLAAWADFDGDGDPDLVLMDSPEGTLLLRNDAGRFVDVTREAGLDHSGASGAAFGDYDNDGVLDLYLSRGWGYVPHAYEDASAHQINFNLFGDSPRGVDFETEGEGGDSVHVELYQRGSPAPPEQLRCGASGRPESHAFDCGGEQAVAAEVPAIDPGFALWRDPATHRTCDRCPTIYSWHLLWTGKGDWNESGIIRGGVRPRVVGISAHPTRGGILYRGTGHGTFERVNPPGLDPDVNGQGAAWVDVNNDGWLDLYVVDAGADGAPSQSELFLNDAHGGFRRVSADAGATPRITVGRPASIHWADFDRDGRLDLFMVNGWGVPPFNRGPYILLHNVSPPLHWLDVRLVGHESNRPGLGARIDVEACGKRQMRYNDGGRSSLSQSIVMPHFGLGDCSHVDVLRVSWPSGRRSELRDVAPDRIVDVEEPTDSPHDIVLVVIDTLRAKSTSLLGYDRDTTPSLVRLSQDAITYEDAISPGNWTVPAHASMFTGFLPSFHGAEQVADQRILATPINPELVTLAQLLAQRGMRTGAFVANATFLTPSLGFNRGFDEYVTNDTRADVIAPQALAWLEKDARPTFLFLNLLDPHEPYEPLPPYDTMFPGKRAEFGTKITDLYWAGTTLTPEMKSHFRSQYDGEVAFADHALGGFFDHLREVGRYDDALVIVTSDHGELLGEHGLAGHGGAAYEELLHVPLLVKLPWSRKGGTRVATRVSTVGVFATILRTAGIPAPAGVQSVPLDRAQRVWAENISFSGDRVTVGYDGGRKLVEDTKLDGTPVDARLYDLAADPDEEHAGDPSAAPDLLEAVRRFRSQPRPVNAAPRPIIDPERERKLRALGYLR